MEDQQEKWLLISKFIRGELTPPEEAELREWLNEKPGNRQFFEEITSAEQLRHELQEFASKEISEEKAWEKLLTRARADGKSWANDKPAITRKFRIWRYAAAAVLLMLAAGGTYWVRHTGTGRKDLSRIAINQKADLQDLAPGKNKATLTLSGGETVVLDSSAIGQQLRQGATSISIAANGQLAYTSGAGGEHAIQYNTVTTPPGGQYQVVLPDGSRVWLNAASAIRFPVAFSDKERAVEVSGEVYFEIKPNMQRPFKVNVRGMEVAVLGTEFNINAYKDEPVISTTLLSGRVAVTNKSSGQQVTLNPGEQVQASDKQHTGMQLSRVDTDQVIAWKNGLFRFSGDDLQAVMRQLARWYNVEVVYEGQIPKRSFSGKIPRNMTASKVLEILKSVGVNFRIDANGGKIIVEE
ncbi:FecR domain-containing protein [Chitinophaga sp. 212800010-3]|uniref:FecR domain-containing protein n=1 Tax=unclassified Chitinophaga TaxID=2619133 RepID=UPI002DF04137|nr:hypothetical protein [Chitinophaga sp. 212800010-3]